MVFFSFVGFVEQNMATMLLRFINDGTFDTIACDSYNT